MTGKATAEGDEVQVDVAGLPVHVERERPDNAPDSSEILSNLRLLLSG